MKRLKIIAILLIINLSFISCDTEQGVQLRIQNNYAEAFHDVKLGNLEFGTIESGAKTEYQHVNSFNLTVSGSTDTDDELTGSITLPPYQNKKYTLTIKESGEFEPTMD